MSENQKHLNYNNQVNLGSFYTPSSVVESVIDLIKKNITNVKELTAVDTSCGYGSFLIKQTFKRVIGADIDPDAIKEALRKNKNEATIELYNNNSLKSISRKKINVNPDEKIIVIGNPPYNDVTSIIRKNIKNKTLAEEIDADVKTRDLGMSFLLSYNKLGADYVCVLHPLSYLIKKTNFNLLNKFTKKYQLVDSLIISSQEFADTSRTTAFPILIGFYKRNETGMTYDYIKNYQFKVKNEERFCLSDFDTIANYLHKYPNKKQLSNKDKIVARFWTMRDINALKRSRTFIKEDTYNTVYVSLEKLPYYCYVDIFKQYIDKMPYYIGNCDVFIDNDEFLKIKECFMYQSITTNQFLKNIKFKEVADAKVKIDKYFIDIINKRLGEKYAKNIG